VTSSDAASALGSAADSFSLVARERRLQEILANIEFLPSLPGIVTRVMELASNDDTQASDFEGIIQQDPSLAAKVLRLVNSPFFGLRHKISSIPQAIVVLGFNSLRGIVIAAKTSSMLSRQLHQYGLDTGGLWKHSISTAATCHVLARKKQLDSGSQELVFVGGLLHDIGKIVLAPYVAKYQCDFDRRLEERGGDLVKTEEELIGISHSDVSGRMADKWGLAPELATLLRDHHETGDDAKASVTLGLLRAADDLCNQFGIGLVGGKREPSSHYASWLDSLGFAGMEEDFKDQMRALLRELSAVFQSLGSK
jgi:putative nucleotidyltransferase with HDIG domain